jgi:hypothetical protein
MVPVPGALAWPSATSTLIVSVGVLQHTDWLTPFFHPDLVVLRGY